MTADRSAAADTLRDELMEALCGGAYEMYDVHVTHGDVADALLPVVRRYADAQVAAERERAIRAVDNLHEWCWYVIEAIPDDNDASSALEDAARAIASVRDDYDNALNIDWRQERADARIARGQP